MIERDKTGASAMSWEGSGDKLKIARVPGGGGIGGLKFWIGRGEKRKSPKILIFNSVEICSRYEHLLNRNVFLVKQQSGQKEIMWTQIIKTWWTVYLHYPRKGLETNYNFPKVIGGK